MPRISVIIPLYNKEKDIKACLQSVLAQSFQDFEILVINDGSTDNSAERVQEINDDRIQLINKKNEGVSKTRNYGVRIANTEYVAFLDADDYWYPNHLENLNTLITTFPNQKWYATAYEKKYNKELVISLQSPVMENNKEYFIVTNYFKNSLKDNIAWTSAIGMKKTFFESLKGFNTEITFGAGEDTDLWVRAALSCNLAFCKTVSATHKLEGSNRISNTPTQKRDFWDMDVFESYAQKDEDLKTFLDLNRYSIALKYKLIGNSSQAKKYIKSINSKSLSFTQNLLLKLPTPALRVLIKLQQFFINKGIKLSSYK